MELTLGELARLVGGGLEGPADRVVSGLQGIEAAGPHEVAFLADSRYAVHLEKCRAGVVLVGLEQKTPAHLAVIRVESPYLAYAKLLTQATSRPFEPLGVHPQALVDPSAKLGSQVSVHALATVGPEVTLGERVEIHPGVHLGRGVTVGDDTVLHPNVVVYPGCSIGQRCIIHAGSVIGADGYAFLPDGEKHFKIPQVGTVQIDDEVELGALNTVDRAANGRTWIQRGVKTDNLVHVAHNCEIGEYTLLVAQVGISGSTKVGRRVVMGGQVGVGGHVNIGDGVMIAGKSGVAQDIEAGEVMGGYPAIPQRLWLRVQRLVRRLPELVQRVRELEKKVAGLSEPEQK